MNTRENFVAALDADPRNQQLRAVFADWLEENGEAVLAAGLRWMVVEDKYPLQDHGVWTWHCGIFDPGFPCQQAIIRGLAPQEGTWWLSDHPSRQAAEESLALALWEQGITE